ncbi:MAG: hypothetical protein AB1651_18780 [Pseudomonadota bacterium]
MARIRISFLGVPEADRPAIVSGINIAAGAIGAQLDWTEPDQAEVCIVDLGGSLWPEAPCAVIRYSSDRTAADAELSRPIRPSALLAALRAAIEAVERERAGRSASAAREAAGSAYYRGASIQREAAAPRGGASSGDPAKGVIYRGVRTVR